MKNKTLWLQIVLVIAGVSVALHLYFKYRVAPSIPFSELELTTVEGTPVKLGDYKGKVIFLNFWATWCGDCIREMPSMIKAQEQLKDAPVVFLLISDDAPEKVAAFRERQGFAFKYLVSKKKLAELDINAIPTSYLIGKDGEVKFTKVGRDEWDSPDMLQRIRNYCTK